MTPTRETHAVRKIPRELVVQEGVTVHDVSAHVVGEHYRSEADDERRREDDREQAHSGGHSLHVAAGSHDLITRSTLGG